MTTTNPALEAEALYAKSKVYIARGLRANAAGESEEYQLWGSLAVELLGKAALAKVHPAMVADPKHHQSVFAACGRPISPDVRTITAKTVFDRLGNLDLKFDTRHQNFCEQMALRRNSELHSGESPFSGKTAEAWEKKYWGAVDVILKMQNESLDSWLGGEEAKAPAKIVQQAEEAIEWAVKNRITHCKQDFDTTYGGEKRRTSAIEESENYKWWEDKHGLTENLEKHERQPCPACGSKGVVGGWAWHEEVSVDPDLDPDEPYMELVDTHYGIEEFFCPACKLHLVGARETSAAGFAEVFIETTQREREFEEEYMNE